jgi:hypothetical protein
MIHLNLKAKQQRGAESGNVLFLILIAVALFAALSYAVTQSTRSGGGDASRETTLVNASQITQYPASVKTAITRMIVSNSIDPDDLLFDGPPFTDLTTTTLQSQGVFYPGSTTGGGGGATYAQAPATVMESAAAGTWVFNGENQVKNIGTYNATTSTSNVEVIAFLPGVKKSVCESIHSRLGLNTSIPSVTGVDSTTNMTYANWNSNSNAGIGAGGGIITSAGILDGQPQGCYLDGTSYVYYHVLIER